MWEHTEKWKEKLSSKKEPELEDLENSQPINIAKKKKIRRRREGTQKVQLDNHCIKNVTHRFNQSAQQKPGTDMGLEQQKHTVFCRV